MADDVDYLSLLPVFIARDMAELRALRDAQFEIVAAGDGSLVSSSVNGTTFNFRTDSMLTPAQLMTLCQMAIDHKIRGLTTPVRRAVAFFR